jgi:hypothetical protein
VARLPINDADEAAGVVNKIINYSSDTSTMSDWRNILCFIADDGDDPPFENLHIGQTENLTKSVSVNHPAFVIQKIYLDAYPYTTSSVGQQAPDVSTAINNRVDKGALIVNYVGHGGELQITHQAVVNSNSVNDWKNFSNLPLFITATCDFGRWDDVDIISPGQKFAARTSAGEDILLNPQGGGIALFTAARVASSYGNRDLNVAIFDTIFSKDKNENYYRLGDVLRLAKNFLGYDWNKLNFVLLGDPATMLAFPKENTVITDSINSKAIASLSDTLLDTIKALSTVRLSGHIENENGVLQNNFNGVIYPTIFDKEETRTTLGNDFDYTYTFTTAENVIYKGIASVTNGRFSIQFQVPKDIKYYYKNGKIVYYATNYEKDFSGYTKKFLVGGINSKAAIDSSGPLVKLYMNDTNFVSGGITDSNPQLLVKLNDSNGINMTGVGIGHDISAVLDSDFLHLISLNDYFHYEIDDYTKGSAMYPFFSLTPGEHTIKVIAWDIYNNSASSDITFKVLGNNNLVLNRVMNYPNPFSNFTNFIFEYNWSEEALNVEVRLFSFTGQLINVLKVENISGGYRTPPLQWDGTDSRGIKVGAGIYLYRIQVSSKSGQYAEASGKLIIVHSK